MKVMFLSVVLLGVFSAPVKATVDVEALEARVSQLEALVISLMNEKTKSPRFVCEAQRGHISSAPWHGPYRGEGVTKVQAENEAIKVCAAAGYQLCYASNCEEIQ